MSTTTLLPPITGVRIAWAQTGEFSNDPNSQLSAEMVQTTLKDLKERAQSNDKENKYIISAIATINASRRSLDTVYKGRELNFKENELLREAYLEEAQNTINFGKQVQDYINSLPAVTIGAVSGLTLSQWLATSLNFDKDLAPWILGLLFAAIGFLANLWFVSNSRKRKLELYIKQDYERDLYYLQYVTRVQTILTSLYEDLDRIHNNVFGQKYPVGDILVGELVQETLKGVWPTFCPKIHDHVRRKLVTPESWSICETGVTNEKETCPYWNEPIKAQGKYNYFRIP